MSGVTVPTTIRSISCKSTGCDYCRFFDRFYRQIAGGYPRVHQMPLANPSAFQDPLVGSIDHFLQIFGWSGCEAERKYRGR